MQRDVHIEPPTVPSLQQSVRHQIALRAKEDLWQLLGEHPNTARSQTAAALVDRLVRAMTILHEYQLEQWELTRRHDRFLLDQMHELLESLIAPPATVLRGAEAPST